MRDCLVRVQTSPVIVYTLEAIKMFCQECGSENLNESNYCNSCGNKLVNIISESKKDDHPLIRKVARWVVFADIYLHAISAFLIGIFYAVLDIYLLFYGNSEINSLDIFTRVITFIILGGVAVCLIIYGVYVFRLDIKIK